MVLQRRRVMEEHARIVKRLWNKVKLPNDQGNSTQSLQVIFSYMARLKLIARSIGTDGKKGRYRLTPRGMITHYAHYGYPTPWESLSGPKQKKLAASIIHAMMDSQMITGIKMAHRKTGTNEQSLAWRLMEYHRDYRIAITRIKVALETKKITTPKRNDFPRIPSAPSKLPTHDWICGSRDPNRRIWGAIIICTTKEYSHHPIATVRADGDALPIAF